MHETLSAGFSRAKLIQPGEEEPNIPQNVTPKTKLNSYLYCQTPHRGLESLHLDPGATPLTEQRPVRRQKIPGVTLQPDLFLLLFTVSPE